MAEDRSAKNSGQQHWLKSYNLKSSSVIAVAAFWSVIFLTLSFFGAGGYLDAKIADPLNFRIRDLIGKGPEQHSSLKIFAIDDATFAMLGTPMPDMGLWAEILDAIASKQPKIILIDAMFSARPEEINQRVKVLFSRLKQDGIPVVTGSYVSPVDLRYKNPLSVSSDAYKADHYIRWVGQSMDLERARREHTPPWSMRGSWYAYGPDKSVENFFNSVGHFQIFAENRVEPFLRLGENLVVPHMSLYAAESLEFRNQKIVVNDVPVALDRQGATPVNFIKRSNLKILSMMKLIEDAKDGYASTQVNEGDVVLILPMFYTGNVDLRPSPYGWTPGGIYVASLLNSVLSGQWLQPVLATEVLTVALCVAACFSAFLFPSVWFWATWTAMLAAVFTASQALFSLSGIVVPYLIPLMASSVAGAHVFALKVRSYERKALALRMALDGAVSPSQMDHMVRHADQVSLEPRERIVTLMFIDVVGFSLSSENMLPRMAFDNLKSILGQISDIIHSHGGVVDKTLGDGLLCYFGYRLDTDETDSNHPEQALRCAMKIQEKMLEESLSAMKSGAPIYPLRIGVNTASCYLGDLGSGQRIEFTVVGNGVNFAKRLESACEMFAVMIGGTTHDLVKGGAGIGNQFTRKLIKIKHHDELIDAYEVYPLSSRRDDVDLAIEAFRKGASLQRLNERMPVKDRDSIQVTTQFGPADIINFSGSGISISLREALTGGTVVSIRLESRTPGLAAALVSVGIEAIKAEVRWSYQTPQGVAHGLNFQGFSAEQQKEFVRLMTEYAFNNDLPTGGDSDLTKIKAS